MTLVNTPEIRLALVGVSRDCFPVELTRKRLANLTDACKALGLDVYAVPTVIENDVDTMKALDEATEAGADAAVIYLGNFGPEGPLSIFAENFPGPVMACAAAEESGEDLFGGRGDAFCGMLNASYNFGLRRLRVHIPKYPVGLPEQLASEIAHFNSVARVLVGLWSLRVFAFGPRPQDFYACNAPIQQLYDLGVEVVENSELDLLMLFNEVTADDAEVQAVAADMANELARGNRYPALLPQLARFEVTLTRFMERNLGSRDYAVFADKCWPAFEKAFGFVPCYINSRLAGRGIPVACEVDIYGAVSEYLAQLASLHAPTLLDINNTVPADMITADMDLMGATPADLFMGFHCGNTPSCCMKNCGMKYQLIMNRLMESGQEPQITRGTLEGQIRPGDMTLFRLQGTADGDLRSYIAEGAFLDVDPRSFGGIGVIAIPNFARFYRYVLVGQHFPHHAAVGFAHVGRILYDALSLLPVDSIGVPLPAGTQYPGENPFA